MPRTNDPFGTVALTHLLHSYLPFLSLKTWEHLVASLTSLTLTVLINVVCVSIALLTSYTLSHTIQPLHANDTATYTTIGMVNQNKTAFLATSPINYAAFAVAQMNRDTYWLQSLWHWSSITMVKYTSSFAFPGVFSLTSYVLGCLPFAALDLIPFCRKYKIQPTKQPAKQGAWMKTICATLVLQCLFPIPAMIVQEVVKGPWTYGYSGLQVCMWHCSWGGGKFPVSAPTVFELVTHLFLCLIIFDLGYYVWHSLHHISRPLYKNIHCIHHEYYAPFVWVTQYTHFCELTAVASLSMTIPVAMGCHPLVHWIWLVLIVQISIDSHTGYELPIGLETCFPCCGGTRHHDTHHAWPKTNFQPFFTYFDWYFQSHYEMSGFKTRAEKLNHAKSK